MTKPMWWSLGNRKDQSDGGASFYCVWSPFQVLEKIPSSLAKGAFYEPWHLTVIVPFISLKANWSFFFPCSFSFLPFVLPHFHCFFLPLFCFEGFEIVLLGIITQAGPGSWLLDSIHTEGAMCVWLLVFPNLDTFEDYVLVGQFERILLNLGLSNFFS